MVPATRAGFGRLLLTATSNREPANRVLDRDFGSTIGDRAAGRCRLAAGGGDGVQHLAKQAHLIDAGRNGDADLFHPDRRDGLRAAGTGAAGDPLVDVPGTAELCLHGCAIDQVAFQRQRADDGGVAREAAAGLHLFLGIGVAVVQREVQDRLAGVRRDGDEDALCRVTAVEHEAGTACRS